jgi:hypothetical protein
MPIEYLPPRWGYLVDGKSGPHFRFYEHHSYEKWQPPEYAEPLLGLEGSAAH